MKFMLALLCIPALSIKAQEVKTSKEFNVTLGNPYEVIDGQKEYYSYNGNAISVKRRGDEVYIQKYDAAKATQKSVKTYTDFPSKYWVLGEVALNEKLYFLFFEKVKGTEGLTISAREISYEKGEFIGKSKEILTINEKVSRSGGFGIRIGGGGGYPSEDISIISSFDKSHFVIQYRLVPENRRDDINFDKIGMAVFNANLEREWHESATMPYTEALMNNIDYAVDKNGVVFILAEVFKEKSRNKYDKEGNANFKYSVISVFEKELEENKAGVELTNKKINQIAFFDGPKDELLLAGFYGNKKPFNIDGIFAVKLEKDGTMIDEKSYEIPVELMKQYVSERAQRKMDKKDDEGADLSLSNMVLRQIVFNEDGSTIFIAEKYYVVSHYNPQTKTTTYTYYYQEILASKINPDGELAWMKKLPKMQFGNSGRGGMSYKYIQSGSNHYFLFLDNLKNLELAENKYPASHQDGRGGYLTAYKVADEDGATQKLSLFDLKNAKGTALYQFQVDRIIDVMENVMLVECYKKGKEDVLIKIEIKD